MDGALPLCAASDPDGTCLVPTPLPPGLLLLPVIGLVFTGTLPGLYVSTSFVPCGEGSLGEGGEGGLGDGPLPDPDPSVNGVGDGPLPDPDPFPVDGEGGVGVDPLLLLVPTVSIPVSSGFIYSDLFGTKCSEASGTPLECSAVLIPGSPGVPGKVVTSVFTVVGVPGVPALPSLPGIVIVLPFIPPNNLIDGVASGALAGVPAVAGVPGTTVPLSASVAAVCVIEPGTALC